MIALDLLLLCKFGYFQENKEIQDILEETIEIIFYSMISLLILKFVWEHAPWKKVKKLLNP